MTGNLLADETSPYLLQHKDNPVHWRPWGPDALAEAAASDKPLLVSVGYAACHWCHVMAHESFEDAETAALINDLYIPVKVDREERPDIDNWLQRVPGILGKPGGWPLTAFLTQKGEPFWAGTYFPKHEGFGLPAFRTVLSDLAGAYRSNPDQMSGNINRINQEMEQAWYQNRRGTLDMRKLDRVAIAIAQRSDSFFGGIVGAPKFPNPAELELLFRGYLRTGRSQFLDLSLVWGDAMCRGGIYDHVGGGFARYALDEEWLVPHFEKMLYDNAAILDALSLLWQHGRQPVLKQKIEETIAFVLREMTVEGGGFASSLDADSEGEEGKFYLWSESEIDQVLSATPADKFKRAYGITAGGNFSHQGQPTGLNILHRVPQLPDVTEADELMFVEQRRLLFKAREKRVRPERDDKVLVDWNGMMIASLANAGVVFGQSAWLEAAKKAFAFVSEKLGEGDLLYQSYRLGRRLHPALADGYAHMARAALTLWEATADKSYLERAKAWTRTLDEQFWDIVQGGYVFSKNTDLPASVRVRSAQDGPLPSANGVMVGVVGRLYYATLNPIYGERANTLIQAFAGDVASTFMQMSTYLNSFEFIASCLEIVVVGPLEDPRTQAMVSAVRAKSLPNRLLVQVGPDESLPAGHPAAGKTMQDGLPTAYVCGARMCSPPVTNPAILTQVLQLPENSPFRRAPGMPDRLADGSRVPG